MACKMVPYLNYHLQAQSQTCPWPQSPQILLRRHAPSLLISIGTTLQDHQWGWLIHQGSAFTVNLIVVLLELKRITPPLFLCSTSFHRAHHWSTQVLFLMVFWDNRFNFLAWIGTHSWVSSWCTSWLCIHTYIHTYICVCVYIYIHTHTLAIHIMHVQDRGGQGELQEKFKNICKDIKFIRRLLYRNHN